jgi:hypothetical protein
VPLRARVRGVPRDLDTIVSKCLTKEPDGRYPTAGELAEDLGRFVRGEPIAARPAGRAERLVRWARRKPTAAAAYGLSALAVLLAAVAIVIAGEKKQTEAARDEAIQLKGVADAGRLEEARLRGIADGALAGEAAARKQLAYVSYSDAVHLALREYQIDNVGRARELLAGCPPELRQWEWHYVHRLCHGDLVTLSGHTGSLTSASFSPDGRRAVTTSADTTARLWNAKPGRNSPS